MNQKTEKVENWERSGRLEGWDTGRLKTWNNGRLGNEKSERVVVARLGSWKREPNENLLHYKMSKGFGRL